MCKLQRDDHKIRESQKSLGVGGGAEQKPSREEQQKQFSCPLKAFHLTTLTP